MLSGTCMAGAPQFNGALMFLLTQMRTALHLACTHEHNQVALGLASHDPSTLDAFDNVSETNIVFFWFLFVD